MITYNRSAFGLNLILRVHGSAVYRAIVPALVAVAIFFLIRQFFTGSVAVAYGEDIGHPYAIGVLVASTTFLIVFRANQGYSRYWEAASATHHMMSKWMDATVHSCVFHMQSPQYDRIKPPSYFDYPEFDHLYMTRDRERGMDYQDDDEDEIVQGGLDSDRLEQTTPLHTNITNGGMSSGRGRQHFHAKRQRHNKLRKERSKREMHAVVKSINYVEDSAKRLNATSKHKNDRPAASPRRYYSSDDVVGMREEDINMTSEFFEEYHKDASDSGRGTGKPFPLLGKPRLDGNWGALYEDDDEPTEKATFFNPNDPDAKNQMGFASYQGGRTPPLFLQELAHLSSLLTAVAFSTLRNDIDGSESPLAFYEPGSDWPEVDPDKDEWMKSVGVGSFFHRVYVFLGMGRTPEEQTRYNAGRPLPVIGGVSDAEIRFLQMAKGPYAKTMLCWNWLSEFCIREHLAGSMGKVGPPIVSRVIQFLGDGMIFYNHARKIMFIPFPFVHAQLSVLFILVMVPCIAFLMDQYTDEAWLGATLTFFTILCLSGIHEVARELENPFRNVPNELPLVTMQAQYNEALITMYSGFHPDHFWDGERVLRKRGGVQSSTTSNSKPQAQASGMNGVHCSGAGADAAAVSHKDEISQLKKQLAQQAKLIEQLAAKMNFHPEEEVQKLEEIAEGAIMGDSGSTAMMGESGSSLAGVLLGSNSTL